MSTVQWKGPIDGEAAIKTTLLSLEHRSCFLYLSFSCQLIDKKCQVSQLRAHCHLRKTIAISFCGSEIASDASKPLFSFSSFSFLIAAQVIFHLACVLRGCPASRPKLDWQLDLWKCSKPVDHQKPNYILALWPHSANRSPCHLSCFCNIPDGSSCDVHNGVKSPCRLS